MVQEHTIIIGAGPCGLAAALELQKNKINPLIIEKGNIVQTIYNFPTHQTFFSTSEKLEIANFPFVNSKQRPQRIDALAYYREVVKRANLRINTYETVIAINKENDTFFVTTTKNGEELRYQAQNVIIATGYYDQERRMKVKGEDLPHVFHYFKEAHPYFNTNVVVIGGKNSAIDTALELYHVNANVTVLYRGASYSSSIKPWILPNFASLVEKNEINMVFDAEVKEITNERLTYKVNGQMKAIKSDFVFAMTGYHPDFTLLKQSGINVDSLTGRPDFNKQTYETNVKNLYVAGVVISGYNGNETFIENGRFHSIAIAQAIINQS